MRPAHLRDRMKKRATDAVPAAATLAQRTVFRVPALGEVIVVAGRDQRRIVEFVAAHRRSAAAKRGVGEEQRRAIAKMQLALGETRGMAEQAHHCVLLTLRIFQALAEHHVAAALAMYRPGLRKAPQAG